MDKLIEKAILLMVQAHSGQFRKESKIPYFIHPLRVAERVKEEINEHKHKNEIIIAALLHDTVEDTWVTNDYIKKEFGEKIALFVEDLTKIKTENKQKCAEDYQIKLIEGNDESKFIKLLDIDDSLKDPFNSERWKSYLKECEEIIKNLEIKDDKLKKPFEKVKKETLKKIRTSL